MTITTKLDPHSKLSDLLITWLRGKYKSLYIHSCSTYDNKTGQRSNLRWVNPIFKDTWCFDGVVTWQIQKNLFLHFHNIYGYQTWEIGNLWLEDLKSC